MTTKTLDDFEYCPDTGKLWKNGKLCKSDRSPYINTTWNGRTIRAHRLIWIIMTGQEAIGVIDHRNRIKQDNRWCNLRCVDDTVNARNVGLQKNNTTGVIGVTRDKRNGRFITSLNVNINGEQQRFVERYDTLEEAANARKRLVAKYRRNPTTGTEGES